MTNDKDSAVLADQTLATAYRDWRLSTTASPIHYKPMALAFVAGWKAALRQPTQSDDEAYDLGKRDGYEKAVQDIDMLTGGDGEYCYSTIEGERHCPNVDTMKARIARRLRQPTQGDALRDQLLQESLVKLRDVRGTEAPKQYAYNLIKRIERVLQEQSK